MEDLAKDFVSTHEVTGVGLGECFEEVCLLFRAEIDHPTILGNQNGNRDAFLERLPLHDNLAFHDPACDESHIL